MKIKKSYIILVLSLIAQWSAYGQEGFYGIKIYRTAKTESKLSSLQRTGFQVVDNSQIKITVSNGKGLMKVLNYAENIVLESKSGKYYPINKKEIHHQLLEQYYNGYSEAGFLKRQSYRWSNRKALAGKSTTKILKEFKINFKKEWDLDWQEDFKLHFVRKKDTIGHLFFKALEAKHVEELPTFEFGDCEPVDRWTYFTTLNFSFDKPQRPIPYQPLLMHRLKRDFTIYFPHNDYKYPQEKLEPLEKYLRSTDYELFETKIFAYSSVEGDSVNNLKLMRKRAEVLNKAIASTNLKVTRTGVEVAENWDVFNEQIRTLNLDTLISRAEWKQYLKIDSVRNQLSSELNAQRTANVELFLQKPMTDEEVLILLKRNIQRQANKLLRYHAFKHRKKKVIPPINLNDPAEGIFFRRILGIRQFASELHMQGRLSKEDLCNLDRNLPEAYYLYVFYHLDNFTDACDEKSYVMSANSLAINQLNIFPEYKEHYKIVGDIQAYIFKKIEQGSYPAEVVLEIDYPNQLAFQVFELGRLDFMEKLIAEGRLNTPNPIPEGPDYYYNYFPKTTYYQFLKAKVLTGETRNPKNTSISRSDWMLEFDQYTFMYYTTHYWKPLNDLMIDSTVSVFQMQEVMKRLLAKPGNLCPYQLQRLNLHFQHKVIQWAALNDSRIEAIEASNEIMQYYDRYGKDRLVREQAVHIGQQLYAINKWFNNALYNWVEELEEKAK